MHGDIHFRDHRIVRPLLVVQLAHAVAFEQVAQQHHDHRGSRKRQQHAEEAEQVAASQHCEDHRDRMQADLVADQLGHQHVAFQQLADHEHPADQQHVGPVAVLHQRSDDRGDEADDEAQVRHETEQARNQTDQQPHRQANQPQAGAIEDAQCQHHQQLAAHERAEDLVRLVRQVRDGRLDRAGQCAVDRGHQPVPVAQQVERHHRDQHQVGQPHRDAQARTRHLAQHRGGDAADRTDVRLDRGQQAVAVERMRIQVQACLQPRPRHVLRPFAVTRQVLDQVFDLTRNQRNKQQQHAADHHQQDHEDDRGRPRPVQPEPFQPVGQRIAQVGQHGGYRKRHQHRRQQPDQVNDDGRDGEQLPAARTIGGHGRARGVEWASSAGFDRWHRHA